MVREHVTHYRFTVIDGYSYPKEGCFPLCEGCWSELASPEARIEYYKMLIDSWELGGHPVDEDKKKDIQMAVANGG